MVAFIACLTPPTSQSRSPSIPIMPSSDQQPSPPMVASRHTPGGAQALLLSIPYIQPYHTHACPYLLSIYGPARAAANCTVRPPFLVPPGGGGRRDPKKNRRFAVSIVTSGRELRGRHRTGARPLRRCRRRRRRRVREVPNICGHPASCFSLVCCRRLVRLQWLRGCDCSRHIRISFAGGLRI